MNEEDYNIEIVLKMIIDMIDKEHNRGFDTITMDDALFIRDKLANALICLEKDAISFDEILEENKDLLKRIKEMEDMDVGNNKTE